jgi:hypothetical protein
MSFTRVLTRREIDIDVVEADRPAGRSGPKLRSRCEFNLGLTGVWEVPAEDRDGYLYMSRWFMFLWLPWFALGALAWTRLAWTFTRPARRAAMSRTEAQQNSVPVGSR